MALRAIFLAKFWRVMNPPFLGNKSTIEPLTEDVNVLDIGMSELTNSNNENMNSSVDR